MLWRPTSLARGWNRPLGLARLNRASRQAIGLAHWWPVCNSGGDVWRDHVTGAWYPTSGTVATTWDRHPFLGHCLNIPSAVDYSSVTGLADLAAPWTASIWYQRLGPATTVLTRGNGNFSGLRLLQQIVTSKIGFTVGGVADYECGQAAPTTRVTLVTWVQPASGNMTVYVDGVADATTIAASAPALPLYEIGGANGRTDLVLSGIYADFRVWNRALSASDVWALYDPATRWDLYSQASPRVFYAVGAAAAPVASRPYIAGQAVSRASVF